MMASPTLDSQMESLDLPKHVHIFIKLLATIKPAPKSVWVMGSRANGRATTASDTDLLVFGSMVLLRTLASMSSPPVGIDCLVVFDGDNYQDPWQEKKGSLALIEWQPIDATFSRYVGIKWIPDDESGDESMGDMIHLQERAVRVWP